MSLLQETIVYIWLIPVVAQVIIPLAMLVGWSIKRVSNKGNDFQSQRSEI